MYFKYMLFARLIEADNKIKLIIVPSLTKNWILKKYDRVIESTIKMISNEYLSFKKLYLSIPDNAWQRLSKGNVIIFRLIIIPVDSPAIVVPIINVNNFDK
ncbi:hypothetical protein [Wukongibacter baidiensis]